MSIKQIGTICFCIFASVFVVHDSSASCSTGFSELTYLSGSAFMAPSNGTCDAPGYKLTTIPDDFELFYSGLIIGNEVTLCTNGYMSGGTCVQYAQGACINGYYDLALNDATFSIPANNTCSSPYATASSVNVCSETPGTVCALSRHECTSGNYLPMSATSCTTCPNGYTCAGGTYTYSENIDQGKVGNTITVIWHDALQSDIDANGAGTIIYGGDINTPVRVDPSAIPLGKRFKGWRFSKSNN